MLDRWLELIGRRAKSSDKKPSSFFGRMKRRFSFGKRSKSLEPEVAKEEFKFSSMVTKWENGKRSVSTDPMDSDQEVLLAVENSRSRKKDRNSRSNEKRSKSAPGSREPSASRSTASAFIAGGVTPPLGVMHDDAHLHNSLVFLLSTTGNKAGQLSWRDKLRSRFSKHKDYDGATVGPTVVSAQEF